MLLIKKNKFDVKIKILTIFTGIFVPERQLDYHTQSCDKNKSS